MRVMLDASAIFTAILIPSTELTRAICKSAAPPNRLLISEATRAHIHNAVTISWPDLSPEINRFFALIDSESTPADRSIIASTDHENASMPAAPRAPLLLHLAIQAQADILVTSLFTLREPPLSIAATMRQRVPRVISPTDFASMHIKLLDSY